MGAGLMLFSLLLAVAAPAGDPVIPLVEGEGDRQCLPDGSLCLALSTGEDASDDPVLLIASSASGAASRIEVPALNDAETVELWPALIAARGDAAAPRYLVGLLGRQSAMYSGGGGSATRLHLFALDPAGAKLGAELLDIPWHGSLLIRACFSEQDSKDRLEACHDSYDFDATLTAAADGAAAMPTLSYRTVATAFPRGSRRSGDNSDTKLTAADLVRAPDPVCSYDRLLRYNPATARYDMDRPAPDCSDYTTP